MSYATSSIWQIIDKVWDMLEANTDFATLIPSANRVKYTDTINRRPDLDVPAESDYPRLTIQPGDIEPHAYGTSNGSWFTLKLHLLLDVGDRRIHLWSEPVEAIYKAFTTWKTYLFEKTWAGDDFNVCFCRLMADENSMKEDRSTAGWHSAAVAEIDVWYQSTDINT